MKILFLTIYPENFPSTRFRIWQYFPYLKKEGIKFKFSPSLSKAWFGHLYGKKEKWRKLTFMILVMGKRFLDIVSMPFYDVVVVQKGIMPFRIRGIEKLVKLFSKKLVFDMDDAVYLSYDTSLPKFLSFFEDKKHISKIISASDLIIVGNKHLKEYAEKFNKNAFIC